VGENGLFDELALRGIKGQGQYDTGSMQELEAEHFTDTGVDEIGAVVCGMQVKNLCYERLAKASVYARNKSRPFIGTNPDQAVPLGSKSGVLIPAGGAPLAYISYAAERQPDAVVGKPCVDLAHVLIDSHSLNPSRTMMVGDRLNTDVRFGNNAGFKTMLVLTGCHGLSDVEKADMNDFPDYVSNSFADIFSLIIA